MMKLIRRDHDLAPTSESGVTMVELMVALAIGSFLMVGAIQIYNQSRLAYVINDSMARVQETAQFAMDTIEADLRMASNWGQNSRAISIDGRSIIGGSANPLGLSVPSGGCGAAWTYNINRPLEGVNNAYSLACPATGTGGAQANSDTVTTRRATVATMPLESGRVQIQSSRIHGQIFTNGVIPAGFTAVDSETHNLLVNSYYVAASSTLIPGVPTLRRKSLTVTGGAPTIDDQEVAPGIENLQIQFGIDVNADNTVDRYVNPGDNMFNPADAAYNPAARVITARVWLLVRSIGPEVGIVDTTDYEPGDVDLGQPNDNFRRLMVSKTILLRNSRS